MALLFMDGFDYYGANCPVTTRWGLSGVAPSYGIAGRFGGLCVKGGSTSPTYLVHSLPAAKSTVSVGLNVNTTGGNTTYLLGFFNGTTVMCSLWVSTTGDITFVRGSLLASNVLGVAVAAIPMGVWGHIGVEFTRNSTTGAVNVYANGVKVLALTGVNTGASDIDHIGVNTLNYQMVDDYYCVDGATWLGEKRIDTLRPSADTAQKDWTPNSGTNNYSRVNEIPVDGDTSYVSSATLGNKDIFDLGDLPITPTSISAVQALVVGRKDDAATRTIAPVLLSNVTESVGSDLATAAGYTAGATIFETDPDTAAAWTPSGVNALKAGYKVTT